MLILTAVFNPMNVMPELESLFSEAIGLQDPEERRAFLDRACEDNAPLKNRVGALIEANRKAASFMSEPVALLDFDLDEPSTSAVGEQPGDIVGRYQLIRQLGEGGMGIVFLAEQTEPVQRQVALKVVKPGLDTKEVITRFESERQSLALMDHPHIARVFDAGTTPLGRPYFVMEYVEGSSILQFCNERNLSTRTRLRLFLKVCDAIQHAHQKGIIHRDIKPQNILVRESIDAEYEPKVIDFGIAKATKSNSTELPTVTQHGQFVGTPAYMSPEQADPAAVDIDIRSDVYALGATLYELLTGCPPFDEAELKRKPMAEVLRIIREELPQLPSRAVPTSRECASTLDNPRPGSNPEIGEPTAANDSTASEKCGRFQADLADLADLAGDLDLIVMQALQKDRDRRYGSVAAFSRDVRRYLGNQTIEARPPNLPYQLQKFVARNRIAVAASALVAATLVGAVIISSLFAAWALAALQQAEVQSENARQENQALRVYQDFLQEDVFGQASPIVEPDRNVTLRFVLDRAAQQLDRQEDLRPDVEAAVRTTLGETYRSLGEYQQSLSQLRQAYKLHQDLQGRAEDDYQRPDLRQIARTTNALAATLLALAEFDQAKTLLERSLQVAREIEDPELLEKTQKLRAALLNATDEGQRAEALLRTIWKKRQQDLGDAHLRTHQAAADLGFAFMAQHRYAEAIQLLEPAYRAFSDVDPLDTICLRAGVRLARLYMLEGKIAQALSLYQRSANDLARLLGEEHPHTLTAKHGLALVQASHQELPEARELLEEVLVAQRRQLGSQHPATLSTIHNLARFRAALGDADGAADLYGEELAAHRAAHGDQHDSTRDALSSLAFFHLNREDFAAAIPYYQALTDSYQAVDRQRLMAQMMLGLCYSKTEQLETARQHFASALAVCQQDYASDWLLPLLLGLCGQTEFELGNRSAAELMLLNSFEQLQERENELPPRWRPLGLRAATRRLAEFYESSTDGQDRERAEFYRSEYQRICQFGTTTEPALQAEQGEQDHGDGNSR